MGSPAIFLLLWHKLSKTSTGNKAFFSGLTWKQAAVSVGRELLAAILALLLAAFALIFFYLYCLPWL